MKTLVRILCPFAPHVCEEIWEQLGEKGFCSMAQWPEYDEAKTVDSEIEIAVQANGKLRATITIPADCDKDTALSIAKATAAASEIERIDELEETLLPVGQQGKSTRLNRACNTQTVNIIYHGHVADRMP